MTAATPFDRVPPGTSPVTPSDVPAERWVSPRLVYPAAFIVSLLLWVGLVEFAFWAARQL
jgi:hypothetical protein